ncbi:MAG: anion transporter, partial [Gemmatimonadetes bacterium]|nr:anion transporter [Gemmatimonadota bacterium]
MFWKAAAILIATYLGVAFTRLPRVNVDRPSAAFTGGVLMVLLGVLSFDAAVRAVDFHTIALLLGMMMLVVALEKAGFFAYLAAHLLAVGTTPMRLMAVVVVATGVLSAFLVNDAVVLLFTPVVVRACRLLRANPVPYLVAEAMASNVGSTATIVGNPQNMLIGISSGISFARFFLLLGPVAIASCAVLGLVVWWLYRDEFRNNPFNPDMALLKAEGQAQPQVVRRATAILLPTIAAFFMSSTLNVSISVIALAAGAAVLLTCRVRPSEVIRGVDWVLLLFFVGLFVVIGGAVHAGVLEAVLEHISVTPDPKGIFSLHLASAVISQVVSNVPLTMLVIPLIQG